MIVDKLVIGMIRTNCYFIKKDNKCIIVDPADKFEKIKAHVKGLDVVGCFVTHTHFDHIGALNEVLEEYNLSVNPKTIKGFDYNIIKTPGHKEDCISIYFPNDKLLFSGDFLFYDTIGRTDLPGSSNEDMISSLKLIEKYPDDIKVLPGHGSETILGEEKKNFNNYYNEL